MARETYEMEEVIAVDAPTSKRRRLTDYFAKLPSNTEITKVPAMSKALPTDRRAAQPKASSLEAEEESPH